MKTLLILLSLALLSLTGCKAYDIKPEEEPGYHVRIDQPASEQEQNIG